MKSMDIKKVVASLSLDLLEVLKVCCLLCKDGIDGVNLYEVTQIGSPQALDKSLRTLVDYGLIQECGSTIYTLYDVHSVVLSEYSIELEILDVIIGNLVSQTYYSPYSNQLQNKCYYSMAQEVVRYIVKNSEQTEGLNYIEFSKLLVNMSQMYSIYGLPERVYEQKDLTIMRALETTLGKLEPKSLDSARILTCQAYFYQAGFYYQEASKKMVAAEKIIEKTGNYDIPERVALFVVKALYHENYGNTITSISFLSEAYSLCVKLGLEEQRCLIAIFISYQMTILGDEEAAFEWSRKVNVLALPKYNILQVFYHLGNSLFSSNDDFSIENELLLTEHILKSINDECPLLARYYYVRFLTTTQTRKGATYYEKYALHISRIYISTSAAMKIFYSQEVIRFTNKSCMSTAKRVVIEHLDSVNILSPDISYSTRLEVLGAYAQYHLADEKYAILADAYIDEGIKIIEQMAPGKEILQKVSNAFSDDVIPASLLLDVTWNFKIMKIEALIGISKSLSEIELMANGYTNIIDDLKKLVKDLTIEFPHRNEEILVINAYIQSKIGDPYKACEDMSDIINKTSYNKKIAVALSAARYSKKIGFIFQSQDFYQMAVSNEYFENLNAETKASLLQEYASILEDCRNSKSLDIWEQAEALTNDTEIKSDIFFSQAAHHYERGDFQLALLDIQLCQCMHEREGLLDERLAYIYAWEANIYIALYRFEEAKASTIKALDVCPDSYKDGLSFNLNYTYAYTLLATEDYSTGIKVLALAKTLATNDKEKDLLGELYEIMHLPISQRRKYFKQPNYDEDYTDEGDMMLN